VMAAAKRNTPAVEASADIRSGDAFDREGDTPRRSFVSSGPSTRTREIPASPSSSPRVIDRAGYAHPAATLGRPI
jgi:hypothetical protein